MNFIKGMTFASFAKRGSLGRAETLRSLRNMKERTGADFIIIVPNAVQDTPQSERIDFKGDATMSDSELTEFIKRAHDMGLRTALKPTVNCLNGTWRAHINFFDKDVPCEPKWSNWFRSYTDFQLHFARIAQNAGCEMFLPGCEMVQSERREDEWRRLIEELRGVYGGLISYNTDKYQEENVTWWDAVDVISSSGYYPIDRWETELDRIEGTVKKFNKPFFFAEAGCMSVTGANKVPNDWSVSGNVDLEGQANWYRAMFTACEKREWVKGFALWDWSGRQYQLRSALSNKGYEIYGKPAEKVVAEFYMKDWGLR